VRVLRRVDHHLERGALIHRGVAIGGLLELHCLVEDEAGVDGSVEHCGQQLLNVSASGRNATGEGHVLAEEAAAPDRRILILGNTYTTDHTAGTNDPEGLLVRGHEADSFKNRVASRAAGEFAHVSDAFFASLGYDIRSSERDAKVGACLVTPHEDDALGTHLLCGEHSEEADSSVTDDGDGLAWRDACLVGRVPPGGVDVREGEESGVLRLVDGAGNLHEGAVGEGHAHGFGLAAGDSTVAPIPTVDARGLQPFEAELAGSVGVGKGGDDEVADLEGGDILTQLFDHADEFVADGASIRIRWHGMERVQIAATHARAGDANDRVSALDELRVRGCDDADIAGAVNVSSSHDPIQRLCDPE